MDAQTGGDAESPRGAAVLPPLHVEKKATGQRGGISKGTTYRAPTAKARAYNYSE